MKRPKVRPKLKTESKSVTKSSKPDTQKILDLNSSAILCSIQNFKGQDRLDIRSYYKDERGELKPTPKGVSVPIDKALDLYKCLRSLLKDNSILKIKT